MRKFFEKVEKSLIRFIVIGLVAVVLVQGFMSNDQLRFYLSWAEQMEGQAVDLAEEVSAPLAEEADLTAFPSQGHLTLGIKDFASLPKALVLVNGKAIDCFHSERVQLQVKARDVVEIDSTAYNFPVEYIVLSRSPNLSYPSLGQTFNSNRSMVMVGKIVVK